MAEVGYGGYDYEFVNELDNKYNCLVCQNVLREYSILQTKFLQISQL